MKNWFVEIRVNAGNEDLFQSVLERIGYKFEVETEKINPSMHFTHPKYGAIEDPGIIFKEANKVIETLNEVTLLEGTDIAIDIQNVTLLNDADTARRIVFASVTESCHAKDTCSSTVIYNNHNSEEERQNKIKNEISIENNKKREALISKMVAATQMPEALVVLRLLSKPESNPTELGHIVDLVKENCNGDLSAFCSKNELKRFYGSINHRKVLGLKARHAVCDRKPPKNPMTEGEARSFAHMIGTHWIESLQIDC